MASYLVTYDLVKKRNYEGLHERIKNYPNWACITESSWIVVTTNTAVQVRDHLGQALDSDDKLFVGAIGPEGAWRNLGKTLNDWLMEYLQGS